MLDDFFIVTKQNFSSPLQIHFRILSFVKITPFSKIQMNILTFRGDLIFLYDLFKGIAI